jgi:hypothetical protein
MNDREVAGAVSIHLGCDGQQLLFRRHGPGAEA